MALVGICVYTALSITGGTVLYYFKYVVGDQSKASLYLFIVGLGLLCGILLAVVLTKRFCKRKVMMASASVPILWSMVADTSDDAELRSGRRMVGLATSSIAFSYKFGLGLGGAIAGLLLAGIGYQANVDQTPQAIHGLVLMMSAVPAFSKLLVVVILFFIRCTRRRSTTCSRA